MAATSVRLKAEAWHTSSETVRQKESTTSPLLSLQLWSGPPGPTHVGKGNLFYSVHHSGVNLIQTYPEIMSNHPSGT